MSHAKRLTIPFSLLVAFLLMSVLTINAHAARYQTKSVVDKVHSTSHVKLTDQKKVHPFVHNTSCNFWHGVELYNDTGELCFEQDWTDPTGVLFVNIYRVTAIKDSGNDGHSESFTCDDGRTINLFYSGQVWSGYCHDITAIYM